MSNATRVSEAATNRPAAESTAATVYVGMDVHKDSVMVAVLPEQAPQPIVVDRLPNDLQVLRRFFARLVRDGAVVQACYEASGAGYVLQRALAEWGYVCVVIAPSMTPQRPGHQRKHDKRDAIELARLFRAGELVPIRIPSSADERVRDLVRCRQTLQQNVLRARHYVSKFLARRGFVFRQATPWHRAHFRWLHALVAGTGDRALASEDVVVLGEYLALLEYTLGRRDALDEQIEALALTPPYAAPVGRLKCYRAIDTLSAMVLITELGDWRRFKSPAQLMAYWGLVPTEHSSGPRERRGSITKAGNSHCRHILVQAAWHYRHRPAISGALKVRQRGQPAAVIAHAWKAQHRLYTLYHRLAARRPTQIAVVATARELVGFLWATMRDVAELPSGELTI
jgi:transposase